MASRFVIRKNMENKIVEYERKIDFLEKKVSELENYNKNLRECLVQNVQFSTKLSNITYEMDCLLVKKGQEIRDLEKKLEQSVGRILLEPIKHDFDMEKDDEIEVSNSQPVGVNNYVEIFTFDKPELKKDPNGYYQCAKWFTFNQY